MTLSGNFLFGIFVFIFFEAIAISGPSLESECLNLSIQPPFADKLIKADAAYEVFCKDQIHNHFNCKLCEDKIHDIFIQYQLERFSNSHEKSGKKCNADEGFSMRAIKKFGSTLSSIFGTDKHPLLKPQPAVAIDRLVQQCIHNPQKQVTLISRFCKQSVIPPSKDNEFDIIRSLVDKDSKLQSESDATPQGPRRRNGSTISSDPEQSSNCLDHLANIGEFVPASLRTTPRGPDRENLLQFLSSCPKLEALQTQGSRLQRNAIFSFNKHMRALITEDYLKSQVEQHFLTQAQSDPALLELLKNRVTIIGTNRLLSPHSTLGGSLESDGDTKAIINCDSLTKERCSQIKKIVNSFYKNAAAPDHGLDSISRIPLEYNDKFTVQTTDEIRQFWYGKEEKDKGELQFWATVPGNRKIVFGNEKNNFYHAFEQELINHLGANRKSLKIEELLGKNATKMSIQKLKPKMTKIKDGEQITKIYIARGENGIPAKSDYEKKGEDVLFPIKYGLMRSSDAAPYNAKATELSQLGLAMQDLIISHNQFYEHEHPEPYEDLSVRKFTKLLFNNDYREHTISLITESIPLFSKNSTPLKKQIGNVKALLSKRDAKKQELANSIKQHPELMNIYPDLFQAVNRDIPFIEPLTELRQNSKVKLSENMKVINAQFQKMTDDFIKNDESIKKQIQSLGLDYFTGLFRHAEGVANSIIDAAEVPKRKTQ